jgi:hypothetical protein
MNTPQTDDRTSTPPQGDEMKQGISNRETSAQEEMERKEYPPLTEDPAQSQKAPTREEKPQ